MKAKILQRVLDEKHVMI